MKRPCIEPGCPILTTKTRCPEHQREHQQAKGYTTQHRAEHTEARNLWAPHVATGEVRCSRCGEHITPHQAWDIDRRPWGWHPSHRDCNRSAGAQHLA